MMLQSHKISYLGRDIEDAIVAGFIEEHYVPAEIRTHIGSRNGEIVDYFVKDIIANSSSEQIALSPEAAEMMSRMLTFNRDNIYEKPEITSYIEHVHGVLEHAFDKFIGFAKLYRDDIRKYEDDGHNCVKVFGDFINKRRVLFFEEESNLDEDLLYVRIVTDFLSTLTDRFAFDAFAELFLPKPII